MIDKFKNNFLLFCKIIAPKMFYRGFSQAHFEIEKKILSKDLNRLNLILPRGLAKTTLLAELYPLYHIFVEDSTNRKFVVIVSKTRDHAINCLTAIKDILDYSMEFRTLFGYHGRQNSISYREDMIVLNNNSIIMAKGMGQPIRGLNYKGLRPTFICLDDPEDENNTKTQEAMNGNLLWLLKGALPALDTKYGYEKCVVIGTPIHQLCIVEQLSKMDNWITIRYSYLINDDTESLWPEAKTVESLLEEKKSLEAIGRLSVFYAERMCQIIGDDSQLFKEEYFQVHHYMHSIENEEHYLINENHSDESKRKIPVNIFMGIDPASSTENKRDFSTIVPLAVDKESCIYVLPYFRKRVTPLDLADAIEDFYKRYKPTQTRIESTQYQEMLRQEMRRRMYIPGLEIKEKPTTRKELRLASLQPRFAQRKVYFGENMKEIREEFLTFPRSSYDDLMDGYHLAQKGAYPPYHEVKINIKRKTSEVIYNDVDGTDWMLV